MMVQFFYCKRVGKQWPSFAWLVLLLPNSSQKESEATFLYSKLEREGKGEGGREVESLLALSARSYQKLFWMGWLSFLPSCEWFVVMCLLKVWPLVIWLTHIYFIYVCVKRQWGLACTSEKSHGPSLSHDFPSISL